MGQLVISTIDQPQVFPGHHIYIYSLSFNTEKFEDTIQGWNCQSQLLPCQDLKSESEDTSEDEEEEEESEDKKPEDKDEAREDKSDDDDDDEEKEGQKGEGTSVRDENPESSEEGEEQEMDEQHEEQKDDEKHKEQAEDERHEEQHHQSGDEEKSGSERNSESDGEAEEEDVKKEGETEGGEKDDEKHKEQMEDERHEEQHHQSGDEENSGLDSSDETSTEEDESSDEGSSEESAVYEARMHATIQELGLNEASEGDKRNGSSSSGYIPSSSKHGDSNDEIGDEKKEEGDTVEEDATEEKDDKEENEGVEEKDETGKKDASQKGRKNVPKDAKAEVGFRVRAQFSKHNLKRWTQTFVKYPLNISGQSPYSEALEKLRAKKQSTIDEVMSAMPTENTTPTAHAQQQFTPKQVDDVPPVKQHPLKRLRTKSSYWSVFVFFCSLCWFKLFGKPYEKFHLGDVLTIYSWVHLRLSKFLRGSKPKNCPR